jgi:hypothetical protein
VYVLYFVIKLPHLSTWIGKKNTKYSFMCGILAIIGRGKENFWELQREWRIVVQMKAICIYWKKAYFKSWTAFYNRFTLETTHQGTKTVIWFIMAKYTTIRNWGCRFWRTYFRTKSDSEVIVHLYCFAFDFCNKWRWFCFCSWWEILLPVEIQ